ncbi:MAG TPA: DUF2264 domain-containing protein [Ohtaekwangia sp.]|nr:DUF2264 domain-containing protein [Ohtaekwangia sp.]
MIRRNFIKGVSLLPGLPFFGTTGNTHEIPPPFDARKFWLETLLRVASPVLTSLSKDQLKRDMPVESVPDGKAHRMKVTYLEALGRTLSGMAPWLELNGGNASENTLRQKFIGLATLSIKHAVTPTAKDYMNFTEDKQPLVDAAFLAHALIRAPRNLWGNLETETQKNLLAALRSTRAIKPYHSNWLLFTAMVEAALLRFSGDCDSARIDYALQEHESWYKGDGIYGDGPEFHYDYYNSYVIQPMMIDILKTLLENNRDVKNALGVVIKRAQRYAEIQERLISPEGTFPPTGRSLAYRCGAFQLLAQMALQQHLPPSLKPAQVRTALTAVIQRTMGAPGTFDDNGWLTIGLAGHQPAVGEHYISTGSLYLCTAAFLPLGLPEKDEFWSNPAVDWTSKKAFSGRDFPIDKAL